MFFRAVALKMSSFNISIDAIDFCFLAKLYKERTLYLAAKKHLIFIFMQ